MLIFPYPLPMTICERQGDVPYSTERGYTNSSIVGKYVNLQGDVPYSTERGYTNPHPVGECASSHDDGGSATRPVVVCRAS